MKKHLGIIAAMLMMCSIALLGSSCSDSRCCNPHSCAPVCEQPCADECNTCDTGCNTACDTGCKTVSKCHYPTNNKLCCYDGITVTARNQDMCMLGDQYPLEFDIHACDDVCDVVVHANLPDGVSYIRSTPEAVVEGKKLTWNIGSMRKGECKPAKVWLKCECEGELCACFCATATPVRFCSCLCAKPQLTCSKTGPCEVYLCDPVNYCITVTNKGSCTAHDVVVTDTVPDQLDHASGLKTLCYKVGDLNPCETRTFNVCFTAAKRGRACNTIVVTACNADSTSCQACTNIFVEGCEITKIGPKEVAIGKNADYTITLTNTGDKSLTEVVVTDCAPSSTSIVAANGATISGNEAVWRLKELKAGEKVTFPISLYSCTPGCYTNHVGVTNCQGICCSAEHTTRWKGRPALNMCIKETDDMICVDDPTSYHITVTNQGSEPDSNVKLVVHFPDEIQPIATTGDVKGTISGQTVTFEAKDEFNARQVLNYRIDARAKAAGDARVVAELTSDSVRTPIVQQESTIVN